MTASPTVYPAITFVPAVRPATVRVLLPEVHWGRNPSAGVPDELTVAQWVFDQLAIDQDPDVVPVGIDQGVLVVGGQSFSVLPIEPTLLAEIQLAIDQGPVSVAAIQRLIELTSLPVDLGAAIYATGIEQAPGASSLLIAADPSWVVAIQRTPTLSILCVDRPGSQSFPR